MVRPPARVAPRARLSDAPLAPRDDSIHIWPGRHVDVGAVRVHIRTTPSDDPDAPPMLCVHGLGGSAHNWTDFAGVLRRHFAIEAIDLPGHGRSGPAYRNNYSLDMHAGTVIRYLEQSGRGPVHLVANSMGGAVSVLVAARRPDLVRTLTLISPAVPDNRVRAALVVVPSLGEGILRLYTRRYTPEQRVKGTIKACFADPKRYPTERLTESIAEQTARMSFPWAGSAVARSTRGLAAAQVDHRRPVPARTGRLGDIADDQGSDARRVGRHRPVGRAGSCAVRRRSDTRLPVVGHDRRGAHRDDGTARGDGASGAGARRGFGVDQILRHRSGFPAVHGLCGTLDRCQRQAIPGTALPS